MWVCVRRLGAEWLGPLLIVSRRPESTVSVGQCLPLKARSSSSCWWDSAACGCRTEVLFLLAASHRMFSAPKGSCKENSSSYVPGTSHRLFHLAL